VGLVDIEAQAEFPKPKGKHPPESSGIVFAFEDCQGVIGVADQGAVATAVLAHDRNKPLIEDVVQKRIGDHGRDHRALRAAEFVADHPSRGLHAGLEHPRDQVKEFLIGDPLREHGEDLRMRHGVEELGEIQIQGQHTLEQVRPTPSRRGRAGGRLDAWLAQRWRRTVPGEDLHASERAVGYLG
jgi:hypothetical protein